MAIQPHLELTRCPISDAALSLREWVAEQTIPLKQARQTRPIGAKARLSLTAEIGVVLAGIIRPALLPNSLQPVVQRSTSGSMWAGSPALGCRTTWGILEALRGAGMVAWDLREPKPKLRDGRDAAVPVRPTDALLELCRACGVSSDTVTADWGPDRSQRGTIGRACEGSVIIHKPFEGDGWQGGEREALEAQMRHLNRALSGYDVRGAGPSIGLVRRFYGSPHFGGRVYSPYQSLQGAERLRMTIDGELVVEVDVRASQLTLLLGLCGGVSEVVTYPYAAAGPFPATALKAWTVQSFGRGWTDWKRWGADTETCSRGYKPSDLAKIMRSRFPVLGHLSNAVPSDVWASIPALAATGMDPMERRKLVGQWIVAQEAEAMLGAMEDCLCRGVPALPVHDSLIVPRSVADQAEEAITVAFKARFGIGPMLRTTQAGG